MFKKHFWFQLRLRRHREKVYRWLLSMRNVLSWLILALWRDFICKKTFTARVEIHRRSIMNVCWEKAELSSVTRRFLAVVWDALMWAKRTRINQMDDKSFSRKPVGWGKSSHAPKRGEHQHLWCYRSNQLILSMQVLTGHLQPEIHHYIASTAHKSPFYGKSHLSSFKHLYEW